MIPVFLLYKNLGLTNSFMVYIIPGMVSALICGYPYLYGRDTGQFGGVAQLDGAGYTTIF
ncbi:MAG: hypothetical protein ACLRMZ_13830 [Blautia marasmi]